MGKRSLAKSCIKEGRKQVAGLNKLNKYDPTLLLNKLKR